MNRATVLSILRLGPAPSREPTHRYGVPLLAVFAISAFLVPPSLAATEPLAVDEMIIVLIDSIDVPAAETGMIGEIAVREGQAVKSGQKLGSLDDREATMHEALARTHFEIAESRARNEFTAELARKKLAQRQQQANEHQVLREIAEKKASSDVGVLASEKSEQVAKNELERAIRSRNEYVESVSGSEIDGLRLQYERSRLETKQAALEQSIDELEAKAEGETAVSHQLGIGQSEIELGQAIAQSQIEKLQVKLQRQQTELAALSTERHKIVSPIDGVVADVYCQAGTWVTAGEPILRVIRLNRLRAEGFVPFDQLAAVRANRDVRLTIHNGPDSAIERDGSIVFISPEIDPVNQEVRFWVEFDNHQFDVLPGMRLSLRSKP